MKWTRPIEAFLELTVALWFLDTLFHPIQEKGTRDLPVVPGEKLALKKIPRPMTGTGSRLHP